MWCKIVGLTGPPRRDEHSLTDCETTQASLNRYNELLSRIHIQNISRIPRQRARNPAFTRRARTATSAATTTTTTATATAPTRARRTTPSTNTTTLPLALAQSPPQLIYTRPDGLQASRRESRVGLVLVMGTDPVSRKQTSRDLQPTGRAGADVAAEVPGVRGAVEGVEERVEGEGGLGEEV